MTTFMRSACVIGFLFTALLAQAETNVAGIALADRYQLDGRSLELNGAGVRSKLFVKVYVGALYLVQTSKNAAEILALPGPKSMQMHILYKQVEARKIAKGWRDGFEANLSEKEYSKLASRLTRFNSLFTDLKKGDIVHMDYLPDRGTQLSINGTQLGNIDGEDFFMALMKVWLGDRPADADLKEGLLGQ